MLRSLKRTLVAGALILVAGCASVIGLTDFDIVDLSDGGADSAIDTNIVTEPPSADAAEEPIVLPPVTCVADAGACDSLGLDAGWRPVAVADGNAICPNGFGEATLTRGKGAAGANACNCAVSGTTPPTNCADASTPISFLDGDSGTTCIVPSAGKFADSPDCQSGANGFAFEFAALVPPTALGATCTAKATGDPTKVTTSEITLCPPIGTCADSVCSADPLGALRACVVADGDLACPTTRFTDKLPIGAAVSSVACSACGCSVATENCGGVFTAYVNTQGCGAGATLAIEAGACTEVAHTAYKSYQYIPAPHATGVVDGGATATGFTYGGARTLCCAP